MRVVCLYADNQACGNYRIFPYRKIKSDIEFILCQQLHESGLKNTNEAHGWLFQRPSDQHFLDYIKGINSEGGITVVEIDDDLNSIPYSNPVHGFTRSDQAKIHEECLRAAKYVHVSTPELARSEKYIVFPNAINLSKYTNPLPKIDRSVLWQGSPTHTESLDLIKPAIQELLSDGVNVILCSNLQWLQSQFKSHKNLHLKGWLAFEDSYRIPSMATINLTPLPDNVFNNKKSELKILEAAAWSIPSVSSDIAPYRRFYEKSNGGNVIVRKEKTKYWIEAIYSLLDTPFLYDNLAARSYECVEKYYNLAVVNQQRSAWWAKVLNK